MPAPTNDATDQPVQKDRLELIISSAAHSRQIILSSEKDFSYVESDAEFRIKIADSAMVSKIGQVDQPAMQISIRGQKLSIGAMKIFQAELPKNFDYFFSTYDTGKMVIYEGNIIVIRKRKGIVSKGNPE